MTCRHGGYNRSFKGAAIASTPRYDQWRFTFKGFWIAPHGVRPFS